MKQVLSILIADDKTGMLSQYSQALLTKEFEVRWLVPEHTTVQKITVTSIDVLILNYKIALVIRQELLKIVRSQFNNVVVLIYGPSSLPVEEILESGADDYINENVTSEVLLKRIHYAWMKIYRQEYDWKNQPEFLLTPDTLFNGLTRELKIKGDSFILSPVTAEILKCLLSNMGKPVTRDILGGRIWGNSPNSGYKQLKTYIYRLRKYLAADTSLKLLTEKDGFGLYSQKTWN